MSILSQYINSIKQIIDSQMTALDSQMTTLNDNLKFWADKYQGHLSVANISESGYKGILTKIQIKDTIAADALDATISINVDGAGAQIIALNTMYKFLFNSGARGDNISNYMHFQQGQTDQPAMTLQLNIPFQTSLVISISNADGFCIFWNEAI